MKKLTGKLSLNKQTLANLDDKELAAVKGGFTYSISTGTTCTVSKMYSQANAFDCGYYMGYQS